MGRLFYLLKGRDMSERTGLFYLHKAKISDYPSTDRKKKKKGKKKRGGGRGEVVLTLQSGGRLLARDGHGNTGGQWPLH